MPLLDSITKKVADQMPSIISPAGHALADYLSAGGFVVYGVGSWNRNRRAALGSLACGIFQAGLAAVTDYPGGIIKRVSFPSHGRIDIGFAGMVGTMPNYVGIQDSREARFFRLQAVV